MESAEQRIAELEAELKVQPGYIKYGEQRFKEGMEHAAEIRTSGLDEMDTRPAHEAFKLGQEAMAQAIRDRIKENSPSK
jgi:hypothetical protein